MRGSIKNYLSEKGYGFIQDEKGDDRFFHLTDVLTGKDYLSRGVEVEFQPERGKKGLRAKRVRVSEGSGRFLTPKAKKMDSQLMKGVVLGVNRDGYKHYGVYAGKGRVIHYTSLYSDKMGDGKIQETGMDHFLRSRSKLFVLAFPARYQWQQHQSILREFAPSGDGMDALFGIFGAVQDLLEIGKMTKRTLSDQGLTRSDAYRVFSHEETVERARSRIGEKKYSLGLNNCEHFAIWCKTGMKESSQISEFLGGISSGTEISRWVNRDDLV